MPAPALHVHREEDEAFYVLEGTVDFVCAGEFFRTEAGAFTFLPRGLPHTFIGVAEPASRVLILLIRGVWRRSSSRPTRIASGNSCERTASKSSGRLWVPSASLAA